MRECSFYDMKTVFFLPSNSGHVSILEMFKNYSKIFCNKKDVFTILKLIMRNIFYNCLLTGHNYKLRFRKQNSYYFYIFTY